MSTSSASNLTHSTISTLMNNETLDRKLPKIKSTVVHLTPWDGRWIEINVNLCPKVPVRIQSWPITPCSLSIATNHAMFAFNPLLFAINWDMLTFIPHLLHKRWTTPIKPDKACSLKKREDIVGSCFISWYPEIWLAKNCKKEVQGVHKFLQC